MDIHHLVKMANQIGDFFAPYPDRTEVVNSIALHLKNSWDPRMRRQIIEYASGGGADLHEPVRQAVLSLRTDTAVTGEAPGDD
jgi:formate dehydrogenase subunit delta